MTNFFVETTNKVLVNQSGLVFIAKYLNDVRFFQELIEFLKSKRTLGLFLIMI